MIVCVGQWLCFISSPEANQGANAGSDPKSAAVDVVVNVQQRGQEVGGGEIKGEATGNSKVLLGFMAQ